MAERSRRGGGRRSGASELEGRDLLVGRLEQAADTGEAARSGHGSSATAGAEAGAAQDATLAQILDRLRVMKARLDVLQAAPEASDEATVALKRAQAQLDQAVQEARGQLAVAAVPDAKRAQAAANATALLTEGAAALKEQAGAVERRLEASRTHETDVKRVVDALEEKSGRLDSGVGALEKEFERRTGRRRRRAALAAGVLVATAAVAFVGGFMHGNAVTVVADEPCRSMVLSPADRVWLEEHRERLALRFYRNLLADRFEAETGAAQSRSDSGGGRESN